MYQSLLYVLEKVLNIFIKQPYAINHMCFTVKTKKLDMKEFEQKV